MTRYSLAKPRRFRARTADGSEVDILVYDRFQHFNSSSGGGAVAMTGNVFLADGTPLSWEAKGRYRVPETDELLICDDPDAP